MYNFLVTAIEGTWDQGSYELERGRFLEYTREDVADKFADLTAAHMNALKRMPCLFAYEGKKQAMRIGKLTKVKLRGRSLYIEFEIHPNIPPISFDSIKPIQGSLDIRDWEMTRTHWAIKDEDLLSTLRKRGLVPPRTAALAASDPALPSATDPELVVDSVEQFVKEVLGLKRNSVEVFFRGHSNRTKYRLEPSLFRKDDKGNPLHLDNEDKMYRELLVSNTADFEGDIYTLDRLVRMQHYSLPTRLLDITSNPLIALFFACNSKMKDVGEVITFTMPPEKIKYFDSDTASCIANLARMDKKSKDAIRYRNLSKEEFNEQESIKRLLHFIGEEKPYFESKINPDHLRSVICVKGKHTNSRIAFQSGAFLLFGHDATLDENGSDDIKLKRIAVRNKENVKRQLDQLNINLSTVFPYIENSAKYIAEKFSFKDKS